MTTAALWIEFAQADIDAVTILLKSSRLNRSIEAYHCQQATEKLFKALLIHEGIEFSRGSRGHNLYLLHRNFPSDHPLKAIGDPLVVYTRWATAFRYPDDDPASDSGVPSEAIIVAALEAIIAFRDQLIDYLRFEIPEI